MKKMNLGYVMAIILMSSILIVESGFASMTTLMNGNTTAFTNSNDTISIKGRNYDFNKNISRPQPIDGIDLGTSLEKLIQYPEVASSNDVDGVVEVLCTIEKNGLVSDVIVLQGDDSYLVNEVVKAVRNVKFKPAMQNGFPVKYRMIIPVKFNLAYR